MRDFEKMEGLWLQLHRITSICGNQAHQAGVFHYSQPLPPVLAAAALRVLKTMTSAISNDSIEFCSVMAPAP